MIGKRSLKLIIPPTIVFALSVGLYAAPQTVFRVASDLWGSLYNLPRTPPAPSKYPPGNGGGSADRVRAWNEIAISVSGLDHTLATPGEHRVVVAQVGPILALRANHGSGCGEPRVGIDFITRNHAGKWRQDPTSQHPLALGAYWGQVTPFVLQTSAQFRAPVPPALSSAEYAVAFDEVKALGGDGIITPTARTADETQIGTFWAYDGTPSLCAPPRLYNQITMHLADQMGTSANPVQLARLLALANVAMADAGSAVWESKYYYQYWRP